MGIENMFEKKLNPDEAFDESIHMQRIAKEKAEREGKKEVEGKDYQKISDSIDSVKENLPGWDKETINDDVKERMFEVKYEVSIRKIIDKYDQEFVKAHEEIPLEKIPEFAANFFVEKIKSDEEIAEQFKGRDDFNDFINDFSVIIKKHFEI